MRIIFLVLTFILIVKSYALDLKKDSLSIERVRLDAIMLNREGNLIESLERIEFAIAESKSVGLSELFINERLRIILANRYSSLGDFDRAIELAQNLETFYKQNGDLENELKVKNNLGVYNRNIGRHALAYNYFFEKWQIQKGSEDVVHILDALDGLSISCIELGRFQDAKMYMNKAEKRLKKLQSVYKEELLLYHYVSRSNYALAISDDIEAENYLLKCVKLTEKLNLRKGADVYNLLGNLLLRQGKNKQALEYARRIVTLLCADEDPLIKDPYLLQSYSLQAKAFLALNKYEEALLNCNKAEEQASFFQRQYMFNESKLHVGELRRENLETGIMALYYQYKKSDKIEYLEQALVYVSRAKSNILNERLVDSKMLLLDNRKDAISLRFKLIFQLNEATKKEDNNEVIVLRNKLDSLNNVLGVKKEAPFLINDLKSFQSNLKKERVCLEYILIDTLLFRFDIQKEKIGWSTEGLKNPTVIFDFYNILRNPESTSQDFIMASNKLPKLLPLDLLKEESIKEISVIPDGVLNYMVFDALPSNIENGGWNNIRYFSEDFQISYQFSMESSGDHQLEGISNYVGFAPDYSKSKKWTSLKNSTQALEQAQDYFGGDTFFGIKATKKKLQELSPTADMLHLYAHGVSNDSSYKSSYIMLQDEELHVDEILALPLKARLCLLTACEVGLGKEYKGEGITGIAWAFKVAGVKNVIQSMWKLNEQSSYQLMRYFFDYLAKETNSSAALTKAKRQYLESSEISDRLKHPYYWAGIGHYGNGAIFTKKATDWWKVVLGFVIVFGVCFTGWKFSTKKRVA